MRHKIMNIKFHYEVIATNKIEYKTIKYSP